jgi:hypothetical protein
MLSGGACFRGELVRRAKALRGAADEQRGGDAAVATLAAAGSADAAVMTALGYFYKQMTSQRVELEREKMKTAAEEAAKGAVDPPPAGLA